ncbi:STAS/SEC14 domain-containing protein [Rufibacter sediminis]|uniref:STAS/SEC14 domain-containing protein n=1 Tax=Rufibacter sediminis TaxID=2762756 RepID=A0ABR6VQU4_9BACT|nr:STAS/SEC14 domain-containing protein [Rufibacter sediminis]MBC3539563.1 STAS/SEC14 domain-containing protein [Rufibacter sediminis]
MRSELVNAFGHVYLHILVDYDNHWIQATWQGYSTPDTVKAGMEAYTEALEEANCHAMLIDTRDMVGSWSHSLEWTLEEWAPKAARAGLQFYALVVKPETFAEATADAFYASIKSFEAEVFSDLATARAWLRQRRLNRRKAGSYQFSV